MITLPTTWLPLALRKAMKARVHTARRWYVRRFRSYGPDELTAALQRVGVRRGDALLLHSGFSELHGFRGSIDELIDTFETTLGAQGHLLMVTLAYRDSAYEYLKRLNRFDVRRTPSMMGMVSEMFRRRPTVRRSLHPTHPVAVAGPKADWFVAGHEQCVHACGDGSPFDKLAQADGCCVFFNTPFATFTFFHHLEHLVAQRLPFPLYTAATFDVNVIDAQGQPMRVTTHAFDPPIQGRRRFAVLEAELRLRGHIRTTKVGASTIESIRVRDAIATTLDMASEGRYFYEMPVSEPSR